MIILMTNATTHKLHINNHVSGQAAAGAVPGCGGHLRGALRGDAEDYGDHTNHPLPHPESLLR